MKRKRRRVYGLVQATTGYLASPESLIHDAAAYADSALAPATLRAYRRQVRDFLAWCQANAIPPMPEDGKAPLAVALYVASLGKKKQAANTVRQAVSALGHYFGVQKNPGAPPARSFHVRKVLQGVVREAGAEVAEATPMLAEHVKALLAKLAKREDVQAARDRALFSLGFSMAARRSELAALDVEDLAFVEDGLQVRVGGRRATGIKRTKTNQAGALEVVPVPFGSPACCPVRLTKKWLERAKITSGPVFRRVWRGSDKIGAERISDRAVSDAVKRYAAFLGLEGDFSGHSLRAGFVTSARQAGIPDRAILAVTRHKSAAMLERYDRDTNLWRDARALL